MKPPHVSTLTWQTLQPALMACETEDEVQLLMDQERAGDNRVLFLRRIHSRLARLRAERERREIERG